MIHKKFYQLIYCFLQGKNTAFCCVLRKILPGSNAPRAACLLPQNCEVTHRRPCYNAFQLPVYMNRIVACFRWSVWRLAVLSAVVLSACSPKEEGYIRHQGRIFGTYYSVVYQHPEGVDLQELIEERLQEFDGSLSTYNPRSVISQINRNDTSARTDHYFETMYAMAEWVYQATGGAFDITVAPLVNAWGFGFGSRDRSAVAHPDTIMPYVGFDKIRLEGHRIVKDDPRIMLDANAIAKGYSSDVIAALLEERGCRNYMVEIGGEVVCRGVNPKGVAWQIGINKPHDDLTGLHGEIERVVSLTDASLATSGNYRQYYYLDGKKYAHTIDPRTGMPALHDLLSATVVAPTCMQADAFATAFMVMGREQALALCQEIPQMECYLIYAREDGSLGEAFTEGFKNYLLSK